MANSHSFGVVVLKPDVFQDPKIGLFGHTYTDAGQNSGPRQLRKGGRSLQNLEWFVCGVKANEPTTGIL